MLNEKTIENLVKAGGKRWTKGNMDRIYFNAETLGLSIERYKTGNIFYAELNGEKISNRAASELLGSKIYVDVIAGNVVALRGCGWENKDKLADRMDEIFEAAIEE